MPKVLLVLLVCGVVVEVDLASVSTCIADLPLRWRGLESAILAAG